MPSVPKLRAELANVASGHPNLELLVLFGSRAREIDARPESDWDFAFGARGPVDVGALSATLSRILGTDRVDLVDLAHANGLLRFRVARDGLPLWERSPGRHEAFVMDALRFWLDAEPVLRKAYDALLEEAS